MRKNKSLPKTILPDVIHKKYSEQLIGITPEESEKISLFSKYRDTFIIHKSSKKDKTSFQITKALLDNLMETQKQIGKKPKLIISIQNYILTCDVIKNEN